MIGKKKAAKAELNEKTDIKTPVSEMVRKFKKQKNSVVALFFILFLWNQSKSLIPDILYSPYPPQSDLPFSAVPPGT